MALNSAKILTDKISTQQHYEIFQGMSFVRNLKRLPRLRLDIIWSQNANSALHHKLKSDRDLYFWEAVRSRKNCIDVFFFYNCCSSFSASADTIVCKTKRSKFSNTIPLANRWNQWQAMRVSFQFFVLCTILRKAWSQTLFFSILPARP